MGGTQLMFCDEKHQSYVIVGAVIPWLSTINTEPACNFCAPAYALCMWSYALYSLKTFNKFCISRITLKNHGNSIMRFGIRNNKSSTLA